LGDPVKEGNMNLKCSTMLAMRHAYAILVGRAEEKINFGSLK